MYDMSIFGDIDFLAYASWKPSWILFFLVILDIFLSYSIKFQLVTIFFQVGVLLLLPRLDFLSFFFHWNWKSFVFSSIFS